jgi:hypothetical protein
MGAAFGEFVKNVRQPPSVPTERRTGRWQFYLLADGRQLKHLIFDDRIVGLLGKLPIHHRLVPQIVG